jgi:hypothetical protein
MKPSIRRTLKLESQTLKTLSPAALALVNGGGADVVRPVASWTGCHKP